MYRFKKKSTNVIRYFFTDSFYDPKVIDERLIKSSNVRLVVSGGFYELYTYADPYRFNFPPEKRPFRGQELPKIALTLDEEGKRRESNLHACRQRIRRLVQSNAGMYGQVTKFVTFTFKENVIDLAYANKEFGKFIKRLNYDLKIKSAYLSVVEFQKRGAIHYHVLFFNVPFVLNIAPTFQSIWGHGNVDVRAISHIKNIGAYITKYLQKEVFDIRLSREKAFFCSKGLYKPLEIKRQEHVAKFLDECILSNISSKTYRSTYYGDITYTTGNINQLK